MVDSWAVYKCLVWSAAAAQGSTTFEVGDKAWANALGALAAAFSVGPGDIEPMVKLYIEGGNAALGAKYPLKAAAFEAMLTDTETGYGCTPQRMPVEQVTALAPDPVTPFISQTLTPAELAVFRKEYAKRQQVAPLISDVVTAAAYAPFTAVRSTAGQYAPALPEQLPEAEVQDVVVPQLLETDTNWLLYGAVGLGVLLLLSKKG